MQALKAAVVVMGVLIVAGVVVLGVTLMHRMSGAAAPIASVTLDEPAGTRIIGMTATPDRTGIVLQGGGPDRVVLLDPAGHVLGRIGLAR